MGSYNATGAWALSLAGVGPVARAKFFGRSAELRVIEDSITVMRSGHGQALFLSGEAGIGKTRLTQEAEALAATQGNVLVLRGECHEKAGAPPYWPWIQVTRKLSALASHPSTLSQEVAAAASGILARFEGAASDHDITGADIAPERARFMLFESVLSLLEMTSRQLPLLVVIEDIHWADESSISLTAHLLPRLMDLRTLLIVTCRSPQPQENEELSRFMGGLGREPVASVAQSLYLNGLEKPDVRTWIASATGREAGDQTAASIHGRTGGNPLFIGELVKLLADDSYVEGAVIPETIRLTIRHRLAGLSSACVRLLEAASVLGPSFAPSVLASLVGGNVPEQTLGLLEEAVAAGVLQEEQGPDEIYRWCHAIIQETILSGISRAERSRLHAEAGLVLEKAGGAHPAQIAHHFAMGREIVGPEKLVHYVRRAGEQALDAYAWAEAIEHFHAATEVSEHLQSRDVAASWFGLGRAQAATYRFAEAWSSMAAAFDLYQALDDVPNLLRVAAYPLPYVPGTRGVISRIEIALSRVPDGSVEASRLLSRYGRLLNLTGAPFEEANAAVQSALDVAGRLEDRQLEYRVLCDAIDIDMHQVRWKNLLEKCNRALALSPHVEDRRSEVWAHVCAALGLTCMRRGEEALAHARAAIAATEQPALADLREVACHLAQVAQHALGRWEEASACAAQGLEASPGTPNIVGWETIRCFEQGELDQGHRYVDQMLSALETAEPAANMQHIAVSLAVPLVERLVGKPDWLDAANHAYTVVLQSPDATGLYRLSAHLGLALRAVARDDPALAQVGYDAIKPHSGTVVSGLCGAERILGLTAFVAGRHDDAFGHLRDAVSMCREAGYKPELAWSCHDFVELTLRSGRVDQTGEAAALLEEGRRNADGVGMHSLLVRLSSLKEQLDAARSGESLQSSVLTARQVEILRLVAKGWTNQEIADGLVLSLNTVLRHVSNIFTRTGVSNRAEAVAFASSRGLLDDGSEVVSHSERGSA